VGPLALLPPHVPAAAPPGTLAGWMLCGVVSEPAREILRAAGFSRAPPAWFQANDVEVRP